MLRAMFSGVEVTISSNFSFQKKAIGKFERANGNWFKLSYLYDMDVHDSVLPIDATSNAKKYLESSSFFFELFESEMQSSKNLEYVYKINLLKSKNFHFDNKNEFRSITLVDNYFNLERYLIIDEKDKTDLENFSSINFFTLHIESIYFRVYTGKFNSKNNFLVIESDSQLDLNSFFRIRNNILISIGFLSGYFFNCEEFIFSNYRNESSLFYEFKNRNQITHGYPIDETIFPPTNKTIKPNNYESILRLSGPKVADYVNTTVSSFLKLVKIINEEEELQTALRLFFEAQKASLYLQPYGLFGCLEIIANLIIENNNRIKFDKKQLLKDDALKVLVKYKQVINNSDFDLFSDSLNQIGKIQNSQVYINAFLTLDISLNLDEKKLLNQRNDFFHGRVTTKNTTFSRVDSYDGYFKELSYISLKLNVLIRKLVLGKANLKWEQEY